MPKVGVGGIGLGSRLTWLLTDLLNRHGEEVELKAICDEATPALDAAREKFGEHIPAFADYRELLAQPGIDWVMIGSRNFLHRDHCVAGFAAGKHVFCEKPLAVTIDQCEEIRNAHRAAGTLFATGFVLRYAPLYRKMHELVQNGAIGRIISIEANENLSADHGGFIMRNWRRHRTENGPHLLEKCSHDIDLINWMIGDLPRRVASFGGLNIFIPESKPVEDRLMKPGDDPPLFRSWTAWEDIDPFLSEKDVEDNQVAILEYRNQVRVMFHTNCCTAFPQRRMLVCGLEGTIEAELGTGSLRLCRIGRDTEPEVFEVGALGGHGGADETIMDDLCHSMTTGATPKATGEEGLISAVTCLAVDEAMQKRQVIDVEPYWERFGL